MPWPRPGSLSFTPSGRGDFGRKALFISSIGVSVARLDFTSTKYDSALGASTPGCIVLLLGFNEASPDVVGTVARVGPRAGEEGGHAYPRRSFGSLRDAPGRPAPHRTPPRPGVTPSAAHTLRCTARVAAPHPRLNPVTLLTLRERRAGHKWRLIGQERGGWRNSSQCAFLRR